MKVCILTTVHQPFDTLSKEDVIVEVEAIRAWKKKQL